MTLRLLLLALAAPLAMHAQLTMLLVTTTANGPVESPAPATYNFGNVASGDQAMVRLRARNVGISPVTVTILRVLGTDFALLNTPSTPYTIAAGDFLDVRVSFSAVALGNYNSTLLVNALSVGLQAKVVVGPALTVSSPCTGPDSSAIISFGRVGVGGSVSCTLFLFNADTQNLTLSPIALTGAAFNTTAPSSVTIPPQQSVSFTYKFTAAATGPASGTLTIATRTYTLTGTGFNPALSTPILSFDTPTVGSNEQHTLTVRLPQPAPVAASGLINLAFTPTVSAVTNDTAVQFVATSKRVASFTVAQGGTAVLLNNQANAVFSTGTTAGRITFTVDAGAFGVAGDPTTTLIVAPTAVAIQSASGTRRANDLDITVVGFDNTYSMGAMSFTFFDTGGGPLGSAIAADFSQTFAAFFHGQQAGSSFLMRVTFPVTGNAASIGAADVTLTNSAGVAHTQRINFP
jgi:hypothetical protein